ncbi:MAG: 50S ribosomal protein L28 [bacterium (Candidatus Ratteibacteria) CG23_combo_of_CG06-09_8_20_14_all_48_7]|uniref:50S ribosomal protein L28 n=1 Tax=bacterium (Candidatus Ratteibacteria) CG23_combo_of_CG06-09_8_20_14_all_48_7 TaxID=2014292 RepID=A0A2G9Y940_9BACT|nr:MAG: 50S ribosomal protein L28 [bacterium (Candidatus Ratteibacteria) CG23_combo_of_CG06-09_8_20_14_all_48_7]
MGKKCTVCGKSRKPGMLLSHSHHRTKKFFGANLQKVRTKDGSMLVCSRCLKSGKVIKGLLNNKINRSPVNS